MLEKFANSPIQAEFSKPDVATKAILRFVKRSYEAVLLEQYDLDIYSSEKNLIPKMLATVDIMVQDLVDPRLINIVGIKEIKSISERLIALLNP